MHKFWRLLEVWFLNFSKKFSIDLLHWSWNGSYCYFFWISEIANLSSIYMKTRLICSRLNSYVFTIHFMGLCKKAFINCYVSRYFTYFKVRYNKFISQYGGETQIKFELKMVVKCPRSGSLTIQDFLKKECI